MRQLREVRIFLASPGDASRERKYARAVVEELNRTIAPGLGLALKPVTWDTDAYPGRGDDPQQVLNRQIVKMSDYHLFVAILWNRLGAPTRRATSGTVEEYTRARRAHTSRGKPDIWLYFRSSPQTLDTLAATRQRTAVDTFKRRISSRTLRWEYPTSSQFKELFRYQLTLWLQAFAMTVVKPRPKPSHKRPATRRVKRVSVTAPRSPKPAVSVSGKKRSTARH